MIKLSGVWKHYDTVVAVQDFNLEVERSQTMGLIGPNGSGKTTLLKMIATLAKPDCGSLNICGFDALTQAVEIRRRVSFMPAEFGIPGNMTIAEYMNFFTCATGTPRRSRESMVRDVMEITDLVGREDIMLNGLSTGNRQRVLLAKTLLGEPEMLILDEPASGLDPRARSEVRALLKELAKMGKTIIISSHILADLEDICDSVCIIEAGEKISSGSIEYLRQHHSAPERIIRLHLQAGDLEKAAGLVTPLFDAADCRIEEGVLIVASTSENCNFILRCLLDNDIEVLEMHAEKLDLEGIFLRSTEGLVT